MGELFRLKSKGDNRESYFLGFYVTKELYSFLSLYCVYNKQARSTVLRDMLENLKNKRIKVSQEEMMEIVAEEATEEWFNGSYESYKDFFDEVRMTLDKRGLSQDQIKEIVRKINKQIYDAEKDKKE